MCLFSDVKVECQRHHPLSVSHTEVAGRPWTMWVGVGRRNAWGHRESTGKLYNIFGLGTGRENCQLMPGECATKKGNKTCGTVGTVSGEEGDPQPE